MALHVPKWRARFLGMAVHVAGWSLDPSTQVGAVVANARKRVVGLGYNGFPDRILDRPEWLANREVKQSMVIHAEVNAILNATTAVEGCALYVSAPPCGECAKFVVQAGIVEVIHLPPPAEFAERWAKSLELSRTIFQAAGVESLPMELRAG